MKSIEKILTLITVNFLLSGIALAGPVDSPLPLLNGKKAKHIFTVPGVRNDLDNVATTFMCTSMEKTKGLHFGVEIFNHNGVLQNVITPTSGDISLNPGQTRIVSTQATVLFLEDHVIPNLGNISGGSARIVSISKKVKCTVLMLDSENNPPTSMAPLQVIKKYKQQGD